LLVKEVQHTDYATLMTRDCKIAAEWAISYFDIEQFDSARKKPKSSRFPVDPRLISEHERQESLQVSGSLALSFTGAQRMATSAGVMALAPTNDLHTRYPPDRWLLLLMMERERRGPKRKEANR
jgi:hypothetical protein